MLKPIVQLKHNYLITVVCFKLLTNWADIKTTTFSYQLYGVPYDLFNIAKHNHALPHFFLVSQYNLVTQRFAVKFDL